MLEGYLEKAPERTKFQWNQLNNLYPEEDIYSFLGDTFDLCNLEKMYLENSINEKLGKTALDNLFQFRLTLRIDNFYNHSILAMKYFQDEPLFELNYNQLTIANAFDYLNESYGN